MSLPNPAQLPSQLCLTGPADLPFGDLASPAEVLDLRYLRANLEYLADLGQEAGVKVLLAQKAYSLYKTYPLIGQYLDGACASGLYEARLAREAMPGKDLHVFSPAYQEEELRELLSYADHVIFNSPGEWQRWRAQALAAQAARPADQPLALGLRLNPEYAEIAEDIYNPAAPGSRLGTTQKELAKALAQDPTFWEGLSGFHVHALCEEGAESLAGVLAALDRNFASYLARPEITWLNLGGGHHFTRRHYKVPLFLDLMQDYKKRYQLEIFVEPGEAVPLDCGWLVSRVLDTPVNEINLAIMDSSASCHMPDVLEMPYRPRCFRVLDDGSYELAEDPASSGTPAGTAEEGGTYTYRLGGPTCLAGDVIGDYSFHSLLQRGDLLVFCDMSIYSHVKRNSFNGMPLPDLYTWDGDQLHCLRHFTYEDFKNKLG